MRGGSAASDYWNQRDKSRSTFEGRGRARATNMRNACGGRLVYCGRTDDMFKVSGIWVAPFEVEQAIVSHPSVLEAAVVPTRDADGLEKPKAFVVLKPGLSSEGIAEALKHHVKRTIGKWKYPRWVEIVTELPKTATGKIQRFKLREKHSAADRVEAGRREIGSAPAGAGLNAAPGAARRLKNLPLFFCTKGWAAVGLWRDFPEKLSERTGYCVFAYSRAGYGHSDRVPLPRPLDYMTREAVEVLPQVLDAIGFKRGVLCGHSDGASIAAIYAGSVKDFRVRGLCLISPHFFTEPEGLASIAEAKLLYETGDLRQRLAKYHADVDNAFRGWNGAWLDPGFKRWNIEDSIPLHPGPGLGRTGPSRPIWHARANRRSCERRLRPGGYRDPGQLRTFAAHRAAGAHA